ncbi:MAG: hypothetical protein ACYCPT_03870, partial [Acidimicrobiales bacterium]
LPASVSDAISPELKTEIANNEPEPQSSEQSLFRDASIPIDNYLNSDADLIEGRAETNIEDDLINNRSAGLDELVENEPAGLDELVENRSTGLDELVENVGDEQLFENISDTNVSAGLDDLVENAGDMSAGLDDLIEQSQGDNSAESDDNKFFENETTEERNLSAGLEHVILNDVPDNVRSDIE